MMDKDRLRLFVVFQLMCHVSEEHVSKSWDDFARPLPLQPASGVHRIRSVDAQHVCCFTPGNHLCGTCTGVVYLADMALNDILPSSHNRSRTCYFSLFHSI